MCVFEAVLAVLVQNTDTCILGMLCPGPRTDSVIGLGVYYEQSLLHIHVPTSRMAPKILNWAFWPGS
jgi:hypothetical protein